MEVRDFNGGEGRNFNSYHVCFRGGKVRGAKPLSCSVHEGKGILK